MHYVIVFIVTLVLFACQQESKKVQKKLDKDTIETKVSKEEVMESQIQEAAKKNHASMAPKDLKKANQLIEKKYGEQWDFCTCVQKNDSINKAFTKSSIPDAEFDRLLKRLEIVEDKCQSFRIEDANKTPEERAMHAKKVKDCLRN